MLSNGIVKPRRFAREAEMTEYTETRNASEFIVGTLLVSGVVRSEDADLAHKIV
jgi:hypothetical protein